jgi:adenine specific DNA methylase Mod
LLQKNIGCFSGEIKMSEDRSDEIRIAVLLQRIARFRNYLKEKKTEADNKAKESPQNWDNAYAKAVNNVYKRSNKIFSGAEDEPITLEE